MKKETFLPPRRAPCILIYHLHKYLHNLHNESGAAANLALRRTCGELAVRLADAATDSDPAPPPHVSCSVVFLCPLPARRHTPALPRRRTMYHLWQWLCVLVCVCVTERHKALTIRIGPSAIKTDCFDNLGNPPPPIFLWHVTITGWGSTFYYESIVADGAHWAITNY